MGHALTIAAAGHCPMSIRRYASTASGLGISQPRPRFGCPFANEPSAAYDVVCAKQARMREGSMTINLCVRDIYRTGEPVTFWVSLDPTDSPISLPSANPYEIKHRNRLIFSPASPPGAVHLTPTQPLRWSWDQRDMWNQLVAPTSYALHFFSPTEAVSQFEISSSRSRVLKSACKWAMRACQLSGPILVLGEPLSGTAITVLSVPFEMIVNDPPDDDCKEIVDIEPINVPLDDIEDYATRIILGSAVDLTTYLIAIKKTLGLF